MSAVLHTQFQGKRCLYTIPSGNLSKLKEWHDEASNFYVFFCLSSLSEQSRGMLVTSAKKYAWPRA